MNWYNPLRKKKGFTVIECKVGEQDHVHCFVFSPPKMPVTQIVKYLKGIFCRFPYVPALVALPMVCLE
jgi:REP element-mobilizing transposase RayT